MSHPQESFPSSAHHRIVTPMHPDKSSRHQHPNALKYQHRAVDSFSALPSQRQLSSQCTFCTDFAPWSSYRRRSDLPLALPFHSGHDVLPGSLSGSLQCTRSASAAYLLLIPVMNAFARNLNVIQFIPYALRHLQIPKFCGSLYATSLVGRLQCRQNYNGLRY